MFGLLNKPPSKQSDYKEGIVTTTIHQGKRWRVEFSGTEWFAVSNHSATLNAGDFVRIVGTVNVTTLLIEPA